MPRALWREPFATVSPVEAVEVVLSFVAAGPCRRRSYDPRDESGAATAVAAASPLAADPAASAGDHRPHAPPRGRRLDPPGAKAARPRVGASVARDRPHGRAAARDPPRVHAAAPGTSDPADRRADPEGERRVVCGRRQRPRYPLLAPRPREGRP